MSPVLRRQRAATAPAEPVERTSAVIQAEIDALQAEEAEADALLVRLKNERQAALRSGDDAAVDRVDVAIARAQRTIERQDAVNPGAFDALKRELRDAQHREDAERRAVQQAEAEAAVQAIVDRIQAGEYDEHAAAITKLLRDWSAAQDLAVAAGVETPHRRLRYRMVEPERWKAAEMETYQVFLDEGGNPTLNEYPWKDDGTLDRTRPRQSVTRVRERAPAEKVPAVEWQMGHLHSLVNLPKITFDRPEHWSASALRERKVGEA